MTTSSSNLHVLAERSGTAMATAATSTPIAALTPLEAALCQCGIRLPIPFLDLCAQVIRDLPLQNILELQRFIVDAKSELATLTQILQTGNEMRFGEAAKAQLRASERDTGTVHLQVDGHDVAAEFDKIVAWDQGVLSAKWDRINASGEDPRQYITPKFSISESRFKAWPEVLRAQFESARTVTPGKPKFVLRRMGANGEGQ